MCDIFLGECNIRTSHLGDEINKELGRVLKPFDKVFYREDDDLTFTHEIKHEIKTINEIPIYTKSYR